MKRTVCILFVLVMLISGCRVRQPEKEGAEPITGKYCVLGVDGERTYPDYTALKFDFEQASFNFGLPTSTSSWIRRGTLTVEDGVITAVSSSVKYARGEDGEPVPDGYYTWVFEIVGQGRLRFIEEKSDVFETYGTTLDSESILVLID